MSAFTMASCRPVAPSDLPSRRPVIGRGKLFEAPVFFKGVALTWPLPWREEKEAAPESEITMKSLALKVQRFLVSEDGPTAVEYAVMLAVILVLVVGTIRIVGSNANTVFSQAASSIQ